MILRGNCSSVLIPRRGLWLERKTKQKQSWPEIKMWKYLRILRLIGAMGKMESSRVGRKDSYNIILREKKY